CQCSSARCSRLSLCRSTLLGMRSAEIMMRPVFRLVSFGSRPGPKTKDERPETTTSTSLPIELGSSLASVRFQRTPLAHRVRSLEDPVLPRSEATEDLRL